MRIAFFGRPCEQTRWPLQSCLELGHEIVALMVPVDLAESTRAWLESNGLPRMPIVAVERAMAEPVLRELEADVIVSACFPWRIPEEVLALARLGGVNVHPSLLPKYRGPEPIFWVLRNSERQTGVSVHQMDGQLDHGPVLAQSVYPIEEGLNAIQIERGLAMEGGELLGQVLAELAEGVPLGIPQDEDQASWAPVPTDEDWVMPTNLPAGWAFQFARGVGCLDGPLRVRITRTGEMVPVRDAVEVQVGAQQDGPLIASGSTLGVQFRDGVVVFERGGY